MSSRAQIPFPIAAPALTSAAIAVHRRNPAPDPVADTAPHTVHGAVALGTYAFAGGMVKDIRVNTAGGGRRAHDLLCPMTVLRHSLHRASVSVLIENGSRALSAATRPRSFSHASSAVFRRPFSMLKRSLTMRVVKTETVAAPMAGTRGEVEHLWLAISHK